MNETHMGAVIHQYQSVENEYEGSTFTFTSSYDPHDNTSTYQNPAEFVSALMNKASRMLLVRGGRYVNGRELSLEAIFPLQFPFGLGDPSQKRRTKISKEEVLNALTRLS